MGFVFYWIDATVACLGQPTSTFTTNIVGGGQYQFSTSPTGGTAPYTYQWTVTPPAGFTNNTGNLTSSTLDLTFTIDGAYTISLQVTDANNMASTSNGLVTHFTTTGLDNSLDMII